MTAEYRARAERNFRVARAIAGDPAASAAWLALLRVEHAFLSLLEAAGELQRSGDHELAQPILAALERSRILELAREALAHAAAAQAVLALAPEDMPE